MKKKTMKQIVKSMCRSRDNKDSCRSCPWGHCSLDDSVVCRLPSDWIIDQIYDFKKGGIKYE